MNKKFFKFISMVVCLMLLFGLTKGVMVANATETPNYSIVSSADELLAAIASADHGDTIGIDCRIEFRESVTLGMDNKMLTINRENKTATLAFYGDSTSIIKNLTFEGNEIEANNSMLCVEQNVDFQNVIFQNCICLYDYGGAIRLSGGTHNLANCIFKNNAAYGGGHLMIEEAYFTIDGCVFREGRAEENGGAIFIDYGSGYEIKNSTIKENHAKQYGGGIYFRSSGVLSKTKLFNNTGENGGDDYAKERGSSVSFAESVIELTPLFISNNLKPIEWDFQTIDNSRSGAKLVLETIAPTEPEIPDESEPTEPDEPTEEPGQPTTPDESETPGESEPDDTEPTEPSESEPSTDEPTENNPSEGDSDTEPDTPQDNTPEETPSSDEGTDEPDQQPEGSSPSNSTVDNSTTDNSVTDNSTTDNSSTTGDIITDNSSSSSTDNSTSSNHESTTTDNSRYSNTTDSNNTSTVNNYYTQPGTHPSNNQPEVQTIVVPVGNTGSGEPIEQTITIQSSPEGNGSGSLEGMTLNVNVNIGSENAADQQEALSPSTVQQSGASWYQVAVLCLLSAILVCVIRKR